MAATEFPLLLKSGCLAIQVCALVDIPLFIHILQHRFQTVDIAQVGLLSFPQNEDCAVVFGSPASQWKHCRFQMLVEIILAFLCMLPQKLKLLVCLAT
ncbi:hypothetical protein Peur_048094 [Populus x canadensis]